MTLVAVLVAAGCGSCSESAPADGERAAGSPSWGEVDQSASADDRAGAVVAVGGDTSSWSHRETDYDVEIWGEHATVTVRQTFEALDGWAETAGAVYTAPMPPDATLGDASLAVWGREYTAAGETKSSLRDEFAGGTYRVPARRGRVPPGPIQIKDGSLAEALGVPGEGRFGFALPPVPKPAVVEVVWSYTRLVPRENGYYHFALPAAYAFRSEHSGVEASDVSVEVTIDGGGLEVADVGSPVAQVDVTEREGGVVVEHEGIPTVDDFALHYRLGSEGVDVGTWASWNENRERGIFALQIEPPSRSATAIEVDEVAFVLDTSETMSGEAFELATSLVEEAIDVVGPETKFRVVTAGEEARQLGDESVPATESNRSAMAEMLRNLPTAGGGGLVEGLERLADWQSDGETRRAVVVVTDGWVRHPERIRDQIRQLTPDNDLYVVGVGSDTNGNLLYDLGQTGETETQWLHPVSRAADLEQILKRLERRVLSDVSIEVSGAEVDDVFPEPVPDLFLGESMTLVGAYESPGEYRWTVRGTGAAGEFETEVDVDLPGEHDGRGRALDDLWARLQVFDHSMTRYYRPAESGDAVERIRNLGREYAIQTRWTTPVLTATSPDDSSGSSAGGARQGAVRDIPLVYERENSPAEWRWRIPEAEEVVRTQIGLLRPCGVVDLGRPSSFSTVLRVDYEKGRPEDPVVVEGEFAPGVYDRFERCVGERLVERCDPGKSYFALTTEGPAWHRGRCRGPEGIWPVELGVAFSPAAP